MEFTKITSLSEELCGLIKAYPYKEFQYKIEGLDKGKLAEFHSHSLSKMLSKGIALKWRDKNAFNQSKGFFVINSSHWHSELFRLNTGKLAIIANYESAGDAVSSVGIDKEVFQFIKEAAIQSGFELLMTKIDISDRETFGNAIQSDGDFVGSSVRLSISSAVLNELDLARKVNNNLCSNDISYRKANESDLARIQEIASKGHKLSHFLYDRKLSTEAKGKIFPEWTTKCVKSDNIDVLTAVYKDYVVGFITFFVENSAEKYFNKITGVLDFVAVDEDMRGKGVGKALCIKCLLDLGNRCDVIETRTMSDNFRAKALYTRLGFQATSSDHHVHFWL